MSKTNLPDDHHVVRFVKNTDLRRDENGLIVGINPSAFKLRDQERYLSASHLEGADADRGLAMKALKGWFSAKFSKLSKAAFTVGQVARVKDACSKKSRVKIANEPKDWNRAYTAVREYPDDLEIRERLAVEHWAAWTALSDIE